METDLLAGLEKPIKLMVILPHPDDESFATGGILAKCFKEPQVTTVTLCLTKGGLSKALLKVGLPEHRERTIRNNEYKSATSILGVDKTVIWEYGDQELAKLPQNELKNKIKEIINTEQPDIVITYGPDGITGHEDHKACSKAVEIAARETNVKRLFFVTAPVWIGKKILGQDVLPPTHEIDIKDVYGIKMLALKAHASQMLISMRPMIWVGVIMRMYGKEFYHRVI